MRAGLPHHDDTLIAFFLKEALKEEKEVNNDEKRQHVETSVPRSRLGGAVASQSGGVSPSSRFTGESCVSMCNFSGITRAISRMSC